MDACHTKLERMFLVHFIRDQDKRWQDDHLSHFNLQTDAHGNLVFDHRAHRDDGDFRINIIDYD